MKHEDRLKPLTSKLDQLAEQHKNKNQVMNQVLDSIQTPEASRYGFWRTSGFAIAAAIAGFIILPSSTVFEDQAQTQAQAVATAKLSPQMMEDLEMLMVLGEDKLQHGS